MGTWKREDRQRIHDGAVMVTVLPIVMSSVKQTYGPSIYLPETVTVDVGLALVLLRLHEVFVLGLDRNHCQVE